MANNWLFQSIIATVMLVPVWVSVGFFQRNFSVRAETFLAIYFVGVSLSSLLFGGIARDFLSTPTRSAISIFLIGLTVGGIANILLFRSVASAPNPGIPIAISNLASLGVFMASICLARLSPQLFEAEPFSWKVALGIAMAVGGVSLIAIK